MRGKRWDLIAIIVILAVAGIGAAAWRSRHHVYSINGISYGATREQAAKAGFKRIVEVRPDGSATVPGPFEDAVCILGDKVVNVVGDHLERDGRTILAKGATKDAVARAMGPPDDITGNEIMTDFCSYVYRQQCVEVFSFKGKITYIEVGHRVTWPLP